jgi:hypothetical protein
MSSNDNTLLDLRDPPLQTRHELDDYNSTLLF